MRLARNKKSEDKVSLLPERPNLTKSQIEFLAVYTSSAFLPISEICRQAGVTTSQVNKWKKNSERFREALRTEHLRTQKVTGMTRKHVMRGMLEAIDMAKDQRLPGGMISGWKEVGRMCGFYEPEKREVILSVDSKQVVQELKNLPREKLLELAAQQDESLEAEYEVIED